jgi:pantetheine-phosphate adenylyltransferase
LERGMGISLHKRKRLLHIGGVRRAIYPGSFDPVTFGHIDVIERAARLFDEVVVAVAFNEAKMALFSIEERLGFLKETLGEMPKVSVARFDTLLVDFARERQAGAVIRGLRAVSDFEFEFQMALMNRKLDASIETIFLMPREDFTYLSSRIVKEIARLGGSVEAFVPSSVAKALRERFSHGERLHPERAEDSHEDPYKTDPR